MKHQILNLNPYSECENGFLLIKSLFGEAYLKIPLMDSEKILTATRGSDLEELMFFKMVLTTVIRSAIVDFNYGVNYNPNSLLSIDGININFKKLRTLPAYLLNFTYKDLLKGNHFFSHLKDAFECLIEVVSIENHVEFKADQYYYQRCYNVCHDLVNCDKWDIDYWEEITKVLVKMVTLRPFKASMKYDKYEYLKSISLQDELDYHVKAKELYDEIIMLIQLGKQSKKV